MYKRNLTRAASVLILSTTCVFASYSVMALQSDAQVKTELEEKKTSTISNDFNEPVTLDSKSQSLDGKRKTSIFIDNVVIKQGSLELLADRVEVDATAGKRQEIIMASGSPASYKQRKEDGSWVEARANEIIYSVASRTISLKGKASITQNEVKVTGDSIVFDMAKEQILASTDDGSRDSVRTVISPGAFSNNKEDESEKKKDKQGDNES